MIQTMTTPINLLCTSLLQHDRDLANQFLLAMEVCRFRLFMAIFLYLNAVSQFQLYSEMTGTSTMAIEEGKQFRVCVSKDRETAHNVSYSMQPISRTAKSKQGIK